MLKRVVYKFTEKVLPLRDFLLSLKKKPLEFDCSNISITLKEGKNSPKKIHLSGVGPFDSISAPSAPGNDAGKLKNPATDLSLPEQNDSVPVGNDFAPADNGAVPVPNDAAPVGSDVAPVSNDAAPVPNHFVPVENHSAPVPNHSAPVQSHFAPVPNHSAPVQNHFAPVQNHSAPVENHFAPDFDPSKPFWDLNKLPTNRQEAELYFFQMSLTDLVANHIQNNDSTEKQREKEREKEREKQRENVRAIRQKKKNKGFIRTLTSMGVAVHDSLVTNVPPLVLALDCYAKGFRQKFRQQLQDFEAIATVIPIIIKDKTSTLEPQGTEDCEIIYNHISCITIPPCPGAFRINPRAPPLFHYLSQIL